MQFCMNLNGTSSDDQSAQPHYRCSPLQAQPHYRRSPIAAQPHRHTPQHRGVDRRQELGVADERAVQAPLGSADEGRPVAQGLDEGSQLEERLDSDLISGAFAPDPQQRLQVALAELRERRQERQLSRALLSAAAQRSQSALQQAWLDTLADEVNGVAEEGADGGLQLLPGGG